MPKMESMYLDKEKEHDAAAKRAKEGVLATADVEKVAKVFQILAEPNRLSLVLALLKGSMCVYHLTKVCGCTASGVSHQLRILRENGIVKAKRFGKFMEYSIADGHIREIVEMGVAHLACAR